VLEMSKSDFPMREGARGEPKRIEQVVVT